MSFGSLSEEAKVALAKGAQGAGTGICSEKEECFQKNRLPTIATSMNSPLQSLAGISKKVKKVQAFHFKGGQGAKTGTGGHLPGEKVVGKIAEVRSLTPGSAAIESSQLPRPKYGCRFQSTCRQGSRSQRRNPIGFKLSAQHIEADIDFALEASSGLHHLGWSRWWN